MSDTGRIRVTEHGPYVVTGVPLTRRQPVYSVHGEPLAWETAGEAPLPEDDRYALCRCGGSQNKPFCDGSHATNGFRGAVTADRRPGRERRELIEGEGLVLSDDVSLCAGYGFCGTRHTSVWDLMEEVDDPEVRATVIRMVSHCPSGRLELAETVDGPPIEPGYSPSIAIIPDGPYWVRGGIPIEAADGFTYEVKNRVTLCRCGASQNKPFCDGAHGSAGFKAD